MKYGVISIVGKPNVGKSTLLNGIFKKDIVIATYKPQTTRNMIEVSYKDKDAIINFIDTPGIHKPKNKLDHFLNSEAKRALKISDITLFLFDSSRPFDEEDAECLKVLKDFNVENVYLIINKIDLLKNDELNTIEKELFEKYDFKKVFKISATSQKDIDFLITELKEDINEYEGNEEEIRLLEKEVSDKFFISEIIRELIIKNYRQEIPYGVAVVIDEMKYDETKNLLQIKYSIIVEKESQKPIIIGRGGNAMKKINIQLREKLSEYYDCKIFTSSEVKIKKDWRNNDMKIKELGYKK